ncbi:hypothetical protein D3C77_392060 [compost metagenome]
MQTNCAAFDQNRFECLNSQTVKRRRTVKQNRMLSNYFFKHIPYFRTDALNFTFSALDVMSQAFIDQFLHHERLEQLQCHFLRQAALVHFQVRTYDNNGTTGIVNPFTEQVLTEASLLPFQHMAEGFQRTVTRSCDRTAATAVVNQSIYCFLQHPLLVLYDDIRSAKVKQTLQTVVAVNYATVQIIQVGCRKTAAIELYHRTKFRRNNRQHIENHPLRLIAGIAECLDDFQTLNRPVTALPLSSAQLFFQEVQLFIDVEILQQLLNRLGAHAGLESVAVLLTIAAVFLLGQKLFLLQRSFARIGNDIRCKVNNLFQRTRRHIERQTHTAWNPFEIPDVGYRGSQLDVTHTLTANFSSCHFDAAAITDDAFITDTLILTAMTFPVFGWAENFLTEQPFLFRFQRTVVDRFRFLHFSAGPRTNFIWGSKPNFHKLEVVDVQQGASLLNQVLILAFYTDQNTLNTSVYSIYLSREISASQR